MRKFPIGLFAVVAIIIAICSAFATKEKQHFLLEYQLWGIVSSISSNPSTSDVSGATKVLLIDGTSPFDFNGGGSSKQ